MIQARRYFLIAVMLSGATRIQATADTDLFSGVERETVSETREEGAGADVRDADGTPSHWAVVDSQVVDAAIRQALYLNTENRLEDGLSQLRSAVIRTRFTSVKAKYFLAKQYLLLLESDSMNAALKQDYLKSAESYFKEVRSALNGSELSEHEKEYYREGSEDLLRRLQEQGSELESPAPAPREEVRPTVETQSEERPEPDNERPQLIVDTGARQNFGGGADVAATDDASRSNPIARLNLNSASEVTREVAEQIMEGTGHLGRAESLDKALQMLAYGYTYKRDYMRQNVTLDTRIRRPDNGRMESLRELVYREYTLMKEALNRYGQYSEISARRQPQLFEQWTQRAAQELTNVPQSRRLAVMQALMSHESGKIHWRSYRPTIGGAAEVGLGQFMPQTARGYDINPYDPQENIIGIARYLNRNIGRSGGSLHEGFARYNGGDGNYRTAAAQRYANRVTALLA